MLISAQIPELHQMIVLQPICQHLQFAQRCLRNRNLSFQVAALAYIRICCIAMQTYQRSGIRSGHTVGSTPSYLVLVERLTEHHSDWWNLCCASENGYLISADRTIRDLLQPLNDFAIQILEICQIL